jgi:hypothetical protein
VSERPRGVSEAPVSANRYIAPPNRIQVAKDAIRLLIKSELAENEGFRRQYEANLRQAFGIAPDVKPPWFPED